MSPVRRPGPQYAMNRTMQPAQDQPSSQSPAGRRHILIVDDDPLFRSLMVGVLRRDFDVSVACDGAEGFNRALERQPDVMVLDLQMPGWDGLKTLRTFRAHPALAGIRVMVLTSDSSRETVLAAIHAGADDYTIKTAFSRDEFRLKLDRLVRQPSDEFGLDAVAATAMTAPLASELRSAENQSDELVAAGRVGWSGSTELLQEAIDAWE